MTDVLGSSDASPDPSPDRSVNVRSAAAGVPLADRTKVVCTEVARRSVLVDRLVASGRGIGVLVPSVGRTVVLVPHPEDEACAVGGLIAHQRSRGREVIVIAATDGTAESEHDADRPRSKRRRQVEALERLGVDRSRIHRLDLPAGAVDDHIDELTNELAELVERDDVLVAPTAFDWHPDHEACGRAAEVIARRRGCRLLGSVSWAHLHPDRVPPNVGLAALALTADDDERRRRALACHGLHGGAGAPTAGDPLRVDRARSGRSRAVEWLPSDRMEYYVVDDAVRSEGGQCDAVQQSTSAVN